MTATERSARASLKALRSEHTPFLRPADVGPARNQLPSCMKCAKSPRFFGASVRLLRVRVDSCTELRLKINKSSCMTAAGAATVWQMPLETLIALPDIG